MLQLKVIKDTVIKRRPMQSAELPEDQKHTLTEGTHIDVQAYMLERDHLRVTFKGETFKGFNTWYAFAQHVQIINQGKVEFPVSKPLKVELKLPYKSQRDNSENPDGSCNVTSIAMAMEYLGVRKKTAAQQFEDELYRYCDSKGYSRHNPYDLAKVVDAYGLRDDFHPNGTINELKEWLAKGNPAVIHGYFTSFGHIIAVCGYNERGLIVHDPYGEWNNWGYDRNAYGAADNKGAFLTYSYGMIERLCIPDGAFWVHFISK